MGLKPRSIRVTAKTSDHFFGELLTTENVVICEYTGYVPEWFPGELGDKYLELEIDLPTGLIRNWKPPTEEQLRKFIDSAREEIEE